MAMDPEVAAKIARALETQAVATYEDLLQQYESEITLTPDYSGYCNPRVTAMVDGLGDGHVSHLKFIPIKEDGLIIGLPAQADQPGATPLERTKSLRTCEVNLRVALVGFHLDFEGDRKLRLGVEAPEPSPTGQRYLVINVKRPDSEPRKRRKKSKAAAGTATAAAGTATAAAGTATETNGAATETNG